MCTTAGVTSFTTRFTRPNSRPKRFDVARERGVLGLALGCERRHRADWAPLEALPATSASCAAAGRGASSPQRPIADATNAHRRLRPVDG